MKIAPLNQDLSTNTQKKDNKPSFKSLGMSIVGLTGSVMQGIENKGYFLSFLIQDGLGMTLPRIGTGLYRDKETTGKYNYKEAGEVALREGLTGPFLVGAAPISLFFATKYCKSFNTNSRLIKILGDNFKELIKNPNLDKSVKNNKYLLQKEFQRLNIEKFYKQTIPEDKNPDETINYILKQMEGFNFKDKKLSEESYKNILNKLNDKLIENSQNLDELCRLSAKYQGGIKTFAAGDVIKAIRDYSEDAIINNANFHTVGEKEAENIKNRLAAKRFLFNYGTVAGTLAGLYQLPKIYAYNKVAPGASNFLEQANNSNDKVNVKDSKPEKPAFKGKNPNTDGWLAKLGKFILKKMPEPVQKEFEYNGYNFTPTMMVCLSLFGLLLPRNIKAYNRAVVDENGKRDLTEIQENLIRDSISSLAVVYTVPILTKCFVNSYENKEGFILTNRASMEKTPWKKFIDVINPYSDLHVLTNTELEALYGNIDSKEKMLNFANFIKNKDGDLEKIISRSENSNIIFNNQSFMDSIKGLSRKEKNAKFISLFENMKDSEETNKLITKLMKGSGGVKNNKISKIARGLNSVPGFIVTCLISPIILGVFIPMLTYSRTRKAHAKMLQEKQQNSKNITVA